MKLRYLAHSSFLITASDGTRIITDPYQPGSFDGAMKYGAFREPVDIATISHEHADHNYVKELAGHPTVIRGAGSHAARGIEFNGVDTFHDASRGSERGKNTVFVFVVDSIRICHCGDLGHVLTPYDASLLGDVDVLLVPIGGYFTIGAAEAWDAVERVQPKLVIPMHFKTESISFPIAKPDDFIGNRSDVKRLNVSEIDLHKGDLPKEMQVLLLTPSL